MKVAIAGYGVEGSLSYEYYKQRGDDVVIVSEKISSAYPTPQGAQVIIGEHVFEHLEGYDMVIRTPSLPPHKIHTDGKIWSATNEFFDKCPAPIIGVTGTKGKGTTASLITSILREAGRKVFLVGNIGLPALSALPEITEDDVVVYELSSFQLWDIEKSPYVAVVLMIEPDHLDIHADMDEYVAAKANICRFQKSDDICIYHPTNQYSAEIAHTSAAHRVEKFNTVNDLCARVESGSFMITERTICSTQALRIVGAYNLDNACAAISAAWQFTHDDTAVERGLESFTGLPHRLTFVRRVNGVDYYDNSIGTTPGSAIATIQSFKQPKVIVLGGASKGASYDEVIRLCQDTDTKIVAIGATGDEIADLCERYHVIYKRVKGYMDEVVAVAQRIAEPGGVVILSPASASFDQYESYADRGEKFIQAVERIRADD